MSWFILTILSINFYALVDVLDKILGDKQFKNTFAYAAITYILACLVLPLLLFWTDFSSVKLDTYFFYAAISGPFYFLLWIFWWTGIKKVEVSRAGAVYSSMPIFSALFAFLFLHEVISLSKGLAILLIILGGFFISLEFKKTAKEKLNSAYLWIILAAVASAGGNLVSKIAVAEINPFAVYFISALAGAPFYLSLLIKTKVREEISFNLKSRKVFLVLILRSFLSVFGSALFYLAIISGPISLVAAILGAIPALIFLYSGLLSFFFPKLIKENITPAVLLQKAAAIILIVGGVVLINF